MTRAFPRKNAPRCSCGQIVKACARCGKEPVIAADIAALLLERQRLETKIAELKRSREAHERAERLAWDRYEAIRQKAQDAAVLATAEAAGL